MANNLTASPLIIDTAGASMIIDAPIAVKRVRWVAKSASAGDDAEIQDKNGRTLWASVAPGSNFVESEGFGAITIWPTGFKVSTLDSGTLYVYYD